MFTTRPELVGTHAMVSSTHWLASQSAMAILERGGNAFDAAVAAGLVLQVVEPHLNGPAGEVPIIAWDATTQRPFVVCGQGTAPRAATLSAFADLGLDLVPGTGLLPACVPGAFGAWMLLLRDHGTLRLRDVLQYAIGYARDGFPVLERVHATIETVRPMFTAHWPSSAAVWLPHGRPPEPGALVTNADLAATYLRLLDEAEAASHDRDGQIEAARDVFYEGFVAEAITDFAEGTPVMDVSGEPHRGLLSLDDLGRWQPTVEDPVSLDYRGLTVLKPGPWSQGPVFLQQLALLDGFDLDGYGACSAELAHVVVECAKLAFADREAFYGDPLVVDVPLAELLSADYAAQRRAAIGDEASGELRPGSPGGRTPVLPTLPDSHAGVDDAMVGEPTVRTSGETRGDTCHVDVVDRHGNMVSATPSGGWLQSSPVIPGLGFPLGTRAQMFWLQEGLPNSLAPGKRPRTTLSPSLALADGSPRLAFGTPGGDQQDQWSLLFLLRHVHHGMNLQEAVDAPAWHTSHFPSSFYPRESHRRRVHIESRVPAGTIAGLRERGHEVWPEDAWSLGRLCAVSRSGPLLRAAANPRGMQGYATGR
ncbi:MAG: gamma-glutamyltransferase family protein [Nocardioidaceae bacterium]